MVVQQRLSEEPENTEKDDEMSEDSDDVSSTTSQDEDDKKSCLDVVETNEQSSFGNIVVKNSSEVHFGNKTFYQGPVTIKQFMYNAPTTNDSVLSISNGSDNPQFVNDEVLPVNGIGAIKNGVNGVNHFENQNLDVERGGLCRWFNNKNQKIKICLLSSCLVFSIFTVLLITFVVRDQINSVSNSKTVPYDGSEGDTLEPPGQYDPDVNITLAPKIRVISRVQWVAQPPVQPANDLKTPVPYVVILHSATDNCSVQAACVLHVRYIQSFHVDSNRWWDIGYNFLVGGDGLAYEGRGWTKEGAFAYGYNAKAIGIAFIGTFNTIMPPRQQILAAKRLIALGVEKGYISKDYKLLAHRQLSPTQSPGDMLFADMKSWPHWVNSPDTYLPSQKSNTSASESSSNIEKSDSANNGTQTNSSNLTSTTSKSLLNETLSQ